MPFEALYISLESILTIEHGAQPIQNNSIFTALLLHECLSAMDSHKHRLDLGGHLFLKRSDFSFEFTSNFFDQSDSCGRRIMSKSFSLHSPILNDWVM